MKGFSDYPTILEHEGVGEVCEVGKKVRNLQIGDKVVCPLTFEKCGDYFSTWGAMAEYSTAGDAAAMVEGGLKVDEKVFHEAHVAQLKIPDEIESVGATMIVTFREVYSTMKRLGFTAGQNIVIYGAGPVGLTFVKFAKIIGLAPVVCVGRDDQKILNAKAMGADFIINSNKTDAGVSGLINNNLKLVKNFGKICVYGVMPKNELLMNWQKAPYAFDLRFAQWPSKYEEAAVHEEVVQLMLDGKLNGMDFISDVFGFANCLEAVEMFKAHKNEKKIVFKF